MTADYLARIVALLQSAKRCGMTFDQAWESAMRVVGVRASWSSSRPLTLLDGDEETTPLEFLRARCRAEWDAKGGRFDLASVLEVASSADRPAARRYRVRP